MADGPALTLRRCRPLLGTFVEIATPPGCEGAIAAAYRAVTNVHGRMSFHEETSDLAALRRMPAGGIVAVDAETVAVLRISETLFDRSAGLFDVAVGAHLVASGFLPIPVGYDAASVVGTAADIEIVDDTHVRCHSPLLIDLGGIAKGHAVDRAAETLALAGVDSAIVNAGGDIRVVGDVPVPVWLRDAGGDLGSAILLADAAVATSANIVGRRRLRGVSVTPHIGRGGASVLADRAVSVVASRCVHADAMTKIVLAEPLLAAEMLAELGGAIVTLPERCAA